MFEHINTETLKGFGVTNVENPGLRLQVNTTDGIEVQLSPHDSGVEKMLIQALRKAANLPTGMFVFHTSFEEGVTFVEHPGEAEAKFVFGFIRHDYLHAVNALECAVSFLRQHDIAAELDTKIDQWFQTAYMSDQDADLSALSVDCAGKAVNRLAESVHGGDSLFRALTALSGIEDDPNTVFLENMGAEVFGDLLNEVRLEAAKSIFKTRLMAAKERFVESIDQAFAANERNALKLKAFKEKLA